SRELTFGKQTDNLACSNFFCRTAHSVFRATRRDWNTPSDFENRMKDSVFIKLLVNDEANWARAGEKQDNGIDPGGMVWQKQKAPPGQSLASDRDHPIKTTYDGQSNKAERSFGGGDGWHCL